MKKNLHPRGVDKVIAKSHQSRQRPFRLWFAMMITLVVSSSFFASVAICQPVISGVSPQSGVPGSSATITGSGFNTTAVNNVVYFGATKATVTAASGSSLTVTVPSGATYSTVSVNDIATGLTGFSMYPFLPKYDNSSYVSGIINLSSNVDFTTGAGPYRVAFGDIDGDGKPDMVVVNRGAGGNSISVYRNTSTSGAITSSSFAAKVDFATGAQPGEVAIGDIDGDGKLDIAVTSSATNVVSIFRNTATINTITGTSLAPRVDLGTTGSDGYGVAIADLDYDGKPELLVANTTPGTISIWRNLSTPGVLNTGSFATKVDFGTGSLPTDLAVGDLDGDGKAEIVASNYGSGGTGTTISVLRNTSSVGSITSSSFSSKVDFTVGAGPSDIVMGDLDGDGKLDLAVGNGNASTISVLRNTASTGTINSASFATKVDFSAGLYAGSAAVGDLDGDGKPDLVVTSESGNVVNVFRNTSTSGSIGTGSFVRTDFPLTGSFYSVAVADVDGDGKSDVAVCNTTSNILSVLRNAPLSAPPSITSLTPSVANPGSAVTITGSGFNNTAANNTVYFGATKATVSSATSVSLTVNVPAGATYAPVSVTNMAGGFTGYSQYPFLPTFDNSAYINSVLNFDSKVDLSSGLIPISAAIGDMDGDGKSDLIVANYNSNTISVYRNTSATGTIASSSFAAKVDFPTGTGPYMVAVADIDGDGKLDIAVPNGQSNTVSVFRNTATSGAITTASFSPKVDFTAGANPYGLVVGDMDGDSKPDMIVTNQTGPSISIFRNIATAGAITTGSFSAKVDFTTTAAPEGLGIGDIDGDGKPDIAVCNYGNTGSGTTVSVFRNTATAGTITTGSLASKVDFTTGAGVFNLVMADIDGDGKIDIATTNALANSISVLRNTATSGVIAASSFATKVDFTTSSFPNGIAAGDINGDGKVDLVTANYSSNTVSIFRNTATPGSFTAGSLDAKIDFAAGSNPSYVAVGDLEGDGKPELVVTNYASNTVSIFRNNPLVQAPSITSVAPNAANPGTSVTITGSGFSNTAANNTVYFGATKANVTAATSASLTVNVPVGATYAPVSVTNAASALTGYSQYPFLSTYDNSSYTSGTVNFSPNADFVTGNSPYSVAVGDLDGDGKSDLVVVNQNSDMISIYRNTSSVGSITTGSFATKVDFATGSSPLGVAIGDLDGDGKPDLAVTNSGSNTVSIFHNTCASGSITSGSFDAKVDFATGTYASSVAIGDLDGDGKPDLAVANFVSSTVSVLRNTSTSGSITTGSFATKVDFTTGGGPYSVAIGDLDGDGKPDLAMASSGSNKVSVLRNTSALGSITSGSFAANVDFATGSQPYKVAIGDLDGDGKSDLVVANYSSSSVSVLRNTSASGSITTGSFASKVDFAVGSVPASVAIGDLDGDGKPDLAVANSSSATVSVLRNTSVSGSISSGSFATKVDVAAGSTPQSVAIGDLDGDGKPDLAVARYSSNTVSIFHNNPLVPVPSITSVAPNAANPGASVTITGSGFNNTAANNIVYFGATRATITAAGATSLTATVPIGATYSPVSLNNTATNLTAYSQYPFLPKFDNSAYMSAALNFDPKVDLAAGSSPYTVAIGDLDGDGKSDLAVTNLFSNTVSVYRNTSASGSITSGSFSGKVDFATGSNPRSVAIGDLDGDGKLDLAVANVSSNTVSVYRNTSASGSITSGSFAANVDFATGSNPVNVAIGDVDGDGKADLVVANSSSNTVSVLRNTSTAGSITSGSFTANLDFATGSSPYSIAIGDLDGDGKPDLAVANDGSNTMSVLRNTSAVGSITSGSFAANVDFSTGSMPVSIAIGDLDGDGKSDLVVANFISNALSVYRNTAASGSITSASFAGKVDFATGNSPHSVAIGDLDGDGKPDLAVANYGATSVSVYRNTSTSGSITSGSFSAKVDFATGSAPRCVAIGDLDGDGKSDLAVANYSSNTVSVLRNNPLVAIAPITGTGAVCVGSTTTMSDSTAGGTWSSNNASIATVGSSNGIVIGVSAGTATISYTVSGSSVTAIVTVNALPSVGGMSGTMYVCIGSATTLENTTGGTWSSSNTSIATIGSTGSYSAAINGVAAGTASISYTMTNSCGSSYASAIVTVYPYPAAITGPSTVCEGITVTFSSATTGGSWATGNPSVISIDPSTGIATGHIGGYSQPIYYETLPAACSIQKIVTVNPAPNAGTITGASSVSAGSTITLSDSVSGGTWSSSNTAIATVSSAGVVNGVSAGTVAISYTATNSCGSVVATKVVTVNAGGTTTCSSWGVVDAAGFSAGAAYYTSMVVDGGGTPYIAYRDAANGQKATVKKYVGSSWVTVGSVGFSDGYATTTSLAIDGTGTPYVAYTDGITSQKATVMKFNGSSWVNVGSPSFSAGPASFTSLAIDGSGTPYVAYVDGANSDKATVMKYNGSSWITVGSPGFSAGTAYHISLAIDGSGVPYVGYQDQGNSDKATVMKYNGSGWVTVGTAGFSAGMAQYISLAIDGSGMPYLGYQDGTTAKATVMKYSGGSWIAVGSSSFSAGNAQWVSLAIDGSGTPYVAFQDSENGDKATVMKYNGSSWVIVGNAGFSAGYLTYISLAMDGSGTPYVGYSDNASGQKATVMKLQGTSVAPIVGAAIVCAGENTTLSNATSGGTWSSSDSAVATVGSSSGVVSGVSAGTAVISYIVGSCNVSAVVTVNPLPNAGTISGTTGICVGNNTNLSNTITGGSWSSGNAAVATVNGGGVVSSVAPGTALISYSVTNSCGANYATTMVTVNPLPNAITGVSSLCAGASATLSDVPLGGTWSSNTAGVASIGVTTGVLNAIASGTTIVTYTMGTGCYRTSTITVNPAPTSITGASQACVGSSVTLSNGTGGGSWNSGNTAVATVNSSTGVVTAVSAGSSVITYTVGACSTTLLFSVNSIPAAGTLSGPSVVTAGSTITLSATATGGSWSSSNGNASVSSAGVVSGLVAGTTIISYTVGSSCGSSFVTRTVTINPALGPGGSTTVCSGSTTTLSNSVPGGVWSSGNNSIATIDAASGVVTGGAPGVVTITYALSGSAAYTTVTVNALPGLVSGTGAVCAGNTLNLSDGTTGGVWSSVSLSVATISATGVVTGVAGGMATISYTLSTGCARTATVTINASPSAISGTPAACVGSTTTLSNTVPGGVWSSYNASIAAVSPTGIVTGQSTGSTYITYALGSCKATVAVTVGAQPAVINGTLKACPGTAATLSNLTPGGGTWSSGDNTIAIVDATSGVVTGLTGGTVDITFTSTTGCYRTAQFTVNPAPVALTGVMTVCPGSMTTLSSSSSNVASWGSSNPSVASVNPTAGYVSGLTTGTAMITYTLGTGCNAVAIVTVLPQPVITAPAAICQGAVATFSASMPGGTWLSSNIAAATIDATSGVANGISAAAGGFRITYTAPNGCMKATNAMTISTPPADFTGSRITCMGSTTTLSASGGTWSSANPSVVNVTNVNTGYMSGVSVGTATVSYIVASTGCYRTGEVTVTAVPAAITGTNVVCAGGTTSLADATAGGYWYSSNTGAATVGSATGIVTAVGTGGTVTITYAIGSYCRSTTPVTINPLPAYIGGTATVCNTAITTLSDATSGGTWSSSNTAIATVGTGLTPGYGAVHGIVAGTATITYKLTATGCLRTTTVTVNACSRPGPSTPATAAFNLYPNPTNGRFVVSATANGTLAIYAMDGKQVGMYPVQAGETEISLSTALAAGVYMCRYSGADGTTVMVRLVVE